MKRHQRGYRIRNATTAWKLAVLIGATVLASSYAQSATGQMDATELLSRLHKTNQSEIAAGKLAKAKGQTAEIRAYGEKLIKDHTQADKEIVSLAKSENITLRAPQPLSADDKTSMQNQAATEAKLKSTSGAEFDKVFLQGMEDGHTGVMKMLQSPDVTNIADARIQDEVKKLMPVLQSHHDTAEHIDSEQITK